MILKSPLAQHNLESGIISGEEGVLETYDFYQPEPEPMGQMELKNFKYQLISYKHEVTADYMVLYEQGEEVLKGWTGSFEAKDSLALVTD